MWLGERARVLAAALHVLPLVGCGGGAAVSPAARPPRPVAQCGDLSAAGLSSDPIGLLADHLRMRVPSALEPHAFRSSIMAAPEPDEGETRLLTRNDDPSHGFGVLATELFRSPTDDLAGAARAWVEVTGHDVEALAVAPPLEVVFMVPSTVAEEEGLVLFARAIVSSGDGLAEHVGFYASAEVVGTPSGRDGCTALARAMAETLVLGARRVETQARAVSLSDGLVVDVPNGYAKLAQPGPDFTVSYLYPIVPLGGPHAQLGVYVGHHPSSHARDVTDLHEEPGQLFSSSVPYHVWTTPGRSSARVHHEEVLAEIPGREGLVAHVFFVTEDAARVAELRAIAESLREAER